MKKLISIVGLGVAVIGLTGAGCMENDSENDDQTPGANAEVPNAGGPGSSTELIPGSDNQAPGTDKWTIYTHPCAGNRTDALHCDDASTCFVGCGTTTNGDQGIYLTTNGGQHWLAPTTTPANALRSARVNDISRSDDGLLYLAGQITGDARVVSMDDDHHLETIWERGTTTDFSFTAGSFRRADNGSMIAESLTGVDLVYREGPQHDWKSGRDFWNDGDDDDVPNGVQITRLATHGDQFYGAGSTISQPPTVFLPKWTAGDFDFHIVQLAADGLGAFNGELWDIDVDDTGIVAGGVNQSNNTGVIFTHNHGTDDPTDPANWELFDVVDLFEGATTWVQGVCRAGSTIYAVGRESSQEWGFVLRSTDSGVTFEDITPYAMESNSLESMLAQAYRCQVTENGVIVAGAAGMFAVFEQ